MFGLGVTELLIIAFLIVFFFGAKKLPDLAKGLGAGIRNFKGELTAPPDDDEDDEDDRSEPRRLS